MLDKIIVQMRALASGEFRGGEATDAFLAQHRQKLAIEDLILAGHEGSSLLLNLLPKLRGREPGVVFDAFALLPHRLEAAHADHEKLVEVRCGDGDEFDAFQHRQIGTGGLIQHAGIEGQPAQLAVDKVFFSEDEFRGLCRGHLSRHHGAG